MVARNRSRDNGSEIAGTLTIGTNSPSTYICPPGREVCDDSVNEWWKDNALTLSKTYRSPIIFNGNNGIPGVNYRKAENLPDVRIRAIAIGHLAQVTPYRDSTQAIASTHPGQPATSLPNFLYELKDVPSMLRNAAEKARTLHRIWKARKWSVTHSALAAYYSKNRIGQEYLMYDFGWRPFFTDLATILDNDEFIRRRQRNVNKIRKGELRTSGSLGSSTVTQRTDGIYFQSLGFVATGYEYATTKFERWFVARWKVDPIPFRAALDGSSRDKLYSALGLTNEIPLNFWNALPWTWFADWFTNVGSIISLMGNRQGVTFSSAVRMTRTETKVSCVVTSKPSWVSANNGGYGITHKQRAAFSPTFVRQDLGLNIFPPDRLATLSALAVTRGRGSSSF
jgi:hypothetical protein